ncbi:hypothetical protein [Mesotoga prima]|uniref:hypothetical protein n=1 Tax=Mesotoga prima TaxID=1184387 RepID=UPI002FDA465E
MAEKEIDEGSDKVRVSDRTERTSQHTADEAVSDSERAEGYEQRFTTFSDNSNDQSFKAIQPASDSFGIDFGDGTVETSKGKVAKPHTQEFFEAKAQGAMTGVQNLDQQPKHQPDQLIAANMTPNNPVMSDATLPNPDEVKAKTVSETAISQGLEDAHTPFESGEVLKPAIEAAGEMGKRMTGHAVDDFVENVEGPVFPYRGLEDSKLTECTKENPRAWDDAISAIPVLSKVGITADHLRAIVRNELHWYDPGDIDSDNKVKKGERVEAKNTLGHAQISPKGIGEFNRDVPEFSAFLKERGFKVPGDETKILEDPSCVPMITASKVASLIKNYESHNRSHPDRPVDINPESLIYGYNADVQRLNQNGKTTYESMIDYEAQGKRSLGYDLQKVYPSSDPDVLGTSKHLRRVLQQLEIVRKPH